MELYAFVIRDNVIFQVYIMDEVEIVECVHRPCRMKYTLYEDGNKVDTHGEYVLSPKDLSLIDEVNTLADMGGLFIKN